MNEMRSALNELHRQASATTRELIDQMGDINVDINSSQDDKMKCEKMSRAYHHYTSIVIAVNDLNFVLNQYREWDEYVQEHTDLSGSELISDRWVSKMHKPQSYPIDYEEEDFFVELTERKPASRPGCKAPFDPRDGGFGTFLKRRGSHFYDEDFYEGFDEIEDEFDQYDDFDDEYPDDDD
jgi:hypothetical protein